MADRLRCAVIGAGAAGLEHLAVLHQCSRVAVVAIAENNSERSKAASERYRIPRSYTDFSELLDQPDIDAVTIALPTHLHLRAAVEALEARKHVLLESPMALSAKEAAKLVQVAKRMNRILTVRENLRFDRQTQAAKVAVDRKDLGEIYHARCFWLRRNGIPRIGSWFTQKNLSGGGCLIDLGSQIIDTCLYLLGSFEVTAVFAQTFAKFGPRGLGDSESGKSALDPTKRFDVEDFGAACLRLKDGRTIVCEVGWAGNHSGDTRETGVDLLGTNAGLSLFPARLFRTGPTGYETINLTLPKIPHPDNPFQQFVNAVLDGKKPLVLPEEGLKVQAVLDAIYASAKTGKEAKPGS
jgi:predicted dehydrogenase